MTVISVVSSCGGVGTTTSAVSIAYSVAEKGYETLLIDLQVSGHCAFNLDVDPAGSVFDWLKSNNVVTTHTIAARDNGLHLLRGDSSTKMAERYCRTLQNGFAQLIEKIRDAAPLSCVIMDTPGDNYIGEVAMASADTVIIPFRGDSFALDGVYATMATLRKLKSPARVILLPTMYDHRRNITKWVLAEAERKFGELLSRPIPQRIAVADATSLGKSIWEYNAEGMKDVQTAYEALIDQLWPELSHVRHGKRLWMYPPEILDYEVQYALSLKWRGRKKPEIPNVVSLALQQVE